MEDITEMHLQNHSSETFGNAWLGDKNQQIFNYNLVSSSL